MPYSAMFSDKPTQISPIVEYWFWLAVFAADAFGLSLFGFLASELSIGLSWSLAVLLAVYVGAIYYGLSTKERADALSRQSKAENLTK